jgi:hypothetical protein
MRPSETTASIRTLALGSRGAGIKGGPATLTNRRARWCYPIEGTRFDGGAAPPLTVMSSELLRGS